MLMGFNPYEKYMTPEELQVFQDQQNAAMWGEVGGRLLEAGGAGAGTLEGLAYGAKGFNKGKQDFANKFMQNKRLEGQIEDLEYKRKERAAEQNARQSLVSGLLEQLGGSPAGQQGFVEGDMPVGATPGILDPGMGSGTGTFEQGPLGLPSPDMYEGPTLGALEKLQAQPPMPAPAPAPDMMNQAPGGPAPGNFPQPLPAVSQPTQQGIYGQGFAGTLPQPQMGSVLTPKILMAMEQLNPGSGVKMLMAEKQRQQEFALKQQEAFMAQQEAMKPFYEKVGSNLIQVDPRTGKYNVIFSENIPGGAGATGGQQTGNDQPFKVARQDVADKYGVPAEAPNITYGLAPKEASEVRKEARIAARKKVEGLSEEIGQLNNVVGPIKRFEKLMDVQSTGYWATRKPFASMDAQVREMNAITKGLIPNMRKPGSGNMTDEDAKMFEAALPSVDKPEATNRNIIIAQKVRLDVMKDRRKFLQDYKTLHGHLEGADIAWDDYMTKNPIFDHSVDPRNFELNPNRVSYREYFGANLEGSDYVGAGTVKPSPGLETLSDEEIMRGMQ